MPMRCSALPPRVRPSGTDAFYCPTPTMHSARRSARYSPAVPLFPYWPGELAACLIALPAVAALRDEGAVFQASGLFAIAPFALPY